MAERRVRELLPSHELLREEAGDVVPDRERKRGRIRLKGLDEHSPRRIPAAAPSELGHELERPFLRAEVGKGETRVRVHDRRDRDTRKVMTLRHHLRPDQHRSVCVSEPPERVA